MTSARPEPRIGYADMIAFACELAMFVIVVVSINRLVDGWRHWLISIAVALLIAVGWARWMAPSSDRRLTDPTRYIAQAVLFVAVGVLAAFAGLPWVGLVFAMVALGAFALSRTEDF